MAKVPACLVELDNEALCDIIERQEARLANLEMNGGGSGNNNALRDTSGHGNHLRLVGSPAPVFVDSPPGGGSGAWQFDCTNRGADSNGLTTDKAMTNGNFTIEVKFKAGAANGTDQVLAGEWHTHTENREDQNPDASWVIGLDVNNSPYVGWREADGTFDRQGPVGNIPNPLNEGQDYVFQVCYDGDNFLLYLDGNHIGTSNNISLRQVTAPTHFYMGRAHGVDYAAPAPNPFCGLLRAGRLSDVSRWPGITPSDTGTGFTFENDGNTVGLWNMAA